MPSSGQEDTFVNLTVSVQETDKLSHYTYAIVKGVPEQGFLNVGYEDGDGWIVSYDHIPNMAIHPPPNDDEDISLTIIAITVRASEQASRQVILPVNIEAVADAPDLKVSPSYFDMQQRNVSLNISVEAIDSDGSENITLIISDVPDNMKVLPAIDDGSGTFTVSLSDLPYLTISSSYQLTPANITVSATSIESSSGDMATVTALLEMICTDSDCRIVPLPTTMTAIPSTSSRSSSTKVPTHPTADPTTKVTPTKPSEPTNPSGPSTEPHPSSKPSPSSEPSPDPTRVHPSEGPTEPNPSLPSSGQPSRSSPSIHTTAGKLDECCHKQRKIRGVGTTNMNV